MTMEDLNKLLAFEVKKEIADRYFGFRRIIEEDTSHYQQNIINQALKLEKTIGLELIRIYVLLRDEALIQRFFLLTGLGETLFHDPYVNQSPTIRQRVLSGFDFPGLTRKWRLRNLFLFLYDSLETDINEYRERFTALALDQETIKEEIELFYRKNDISGIMLFLRNMDGDSGGLLATPPNQGGAEAIQDRMRLTPPNPVEKLLPLLQAIPPSRDIKDQLKALINEAADQQPDFDLKDLKDLKIAP